MPTFETQGKTRAAPARVFAFILDLDRWPLFRGYGPLPGIRRATLADGASFGLGARVRVENTDGSVHHECVTAYDPPRRYAVTMVLVPPAAYVLARIDEEVVLEPTAGEGTVIRRRFTTVPRAWWTAPVAWLFGGFLLARAVARHDEAVGRALDEPEGPGS